LTDALDTSKQQNMLHRITDSFVVCMLLLINTIRAVQQMMTMMTMTATV